MKKQFLVATQHCSSHTPSGLKTAIDGCLSWIAGEWLTTDFEIDAVTVVNRLDETTMVAVVASREVSV